MEPAPDLDRPDHERGDPAYMALAGDHEEGRVPDQVVRKVSSHVVEKEYIGSPHLAGGKLQPLEPAVLLRVPLEVVVLPAEVKPDEAGENTLRQRSVRG